MTPETGKGGNPRASQQFQWDNEASRKGSIAWGCWECGNEDSRVRDTDKDEEGVRVRLRMCTRCGSSWETEERRITRGSFLLRASKRRYAAFRRKRYEVRRCPLCEETYMSGKYVEHTKSNKTHLARLRERAKRRDERERVYQRQLMRAQRAAKKGTTTYTMICHRCGGDYEIGKYKFHRHRVTK